MFVLWGVVWDCRTLAKPVPLAWPLAKPVPLAIWPGHCRGLYDYYINTQFFIANDKYYEFCSTARWSEIAVHWRSQSHWPGHWRSQSHSQIAVIYMTAILAFSVSSRMINIKNFVPLAPLSLLRKGLRCHSMVCAHWELILPSFKYEWELHCTFPPILSTGES
jgi:hypothetical protein